MLCSTKLLVVAGGFLAVQTPEERLFHQQSDLFSGFGDTAVSSTSILLKREEK